MGTQEHAVEVRAVSVGSCNVAPYATTFGELHIGDYFIDLDEDGAMIAAQERWAVRLFRKGYPDRAQSFGGPLDFQMKVDQHVLRVDLTR